MAQQEQQQAPIAFPVIARPNFTDADWIEQRQRERAAQSQTPFRTRPLLVIRNRKAGSIPTLIALSLFGFMIFVVAAIV